MAVQPSDPTHSAIALVPVYSLPRGVALRPDAQSPVVDARAQVVGMALCHPGSEPVWRTDVGAVLTELRQRSGDALECLWVVTPAAIDACAVLIARYGQEIQWALDARGLCRLLVAADHCGSLERGLERAGIAGYCDSRHDGLDRPSIVEMSRLRRDAMASARALAVLYNHACLLPEPLLATESIANALQTRIFLHRPLVVQAGPAEQALTALKSMPHGAVSDEQALHLERLLGRVIGMARGNARFHSVYDNLRTVPGRFAATGLVNLQTLPQSARFPAGPLRQAAEGLRGSLRCPDDHCLVSADASQIEPRVVGILTGERALRDWPAAGHDLYTLVADALFATGPECADPAVGRSRRALGKHVTLKVPFGVGPQKLLSAILDDPICTGLVPAGESGLRLMESAHQRFHDRFPRIRMWCRSVETAAMLAMVHIPSPLGMISVGREGDDLSIALPSGRCLRIANVELGQDGRGDPELCSGRDRYYGAKFLQHITTAIARDLLLHVMVTVELAGFPVLGHVHDSVVCMVPSARADACAAALLQAWRTPPPWANGLVLDAKLSRGTTMMLDGL